MEIISRAQAGEKIPLEAGRLVQIGRGAGADIAVAADPLLSEPHFAFWWDEKGCRIQDLQSARGTFLNGQKISEAAVRNGDKIVVGNTHFVVRVKRDFGVPTVAAGLQPRGVSIAELEKRPTADSVLPLSQTGERRDLVGFLRTQTLPLFAILDAARDPRVLEILRDCNQRYQSLYEGAKGEALAAFAPYLVELPSTSPLIQTLVDRAWGKSWGIYLTSASLFADTRRHFRRFLLVQAEDGRKLYFRFYDPRVLRVFLPTCTPQETEEFFGPLSSIFMEGERPATLVHFAKTGRGLNQDVIRIAADRGVNISTGSVPPSI